MALRLRLAAGLLAVASFHLQAAEWSGRGVFAFAAPDGCPLRVAGESGALCNRVALDDTHTRASVDEPGHVIAFANAHAYTSSTIVGDVLLQGSGKAANGERVPLNVHIVLRKRGQAWSASSHTHAPMRGRFTDIRIAPYQVKAASAGAAQVIVTAQEIHASMAHPATALRMARELLDVRDNRSTADRAPDITIGLGVREAVLPVMRASLRLEPQAAGDIDQVLGQGSWALQLRALSSKIPDHVIQREMFLFSMHDVPALHPLMTRGIEKNELLTVGAVAGKGYLRLGDRQEDFPAAAQTARAFLQQSFIGLVLGWHQQHPEASGAR